MEFNCEGQNGGNNGETMMYNYGLDHRYICGKFLVLTIWMILWVVDLIILAIRRITSHFGWVELTSVVSYLMECIWEER